MEYSSTKSNRSKVSPPSPLWNIASVKSSNYDPSELSMNNDQNSIIIEEDKEMDETTRKSKSSHHHKRTVLPQIKGNQNTTMNDFYNKQSKPTAYYYSLRFERTKLGTMSTKVIKGTVNKIMNKWRSIARRSEKALTDHNSSTTDTPKWANYLQKVSKAKAPVNKSHIKKGVKPNYRYAAKLRYPAYGSRRPKRKQY